MGVRVKFLLIMAVVHFCTANAGSNNRDVGTSYFILMHNYMQKLIAQRIANRFNTSSVAGNNPVYPRIGGGVRETNPANAPYIAKIDLFSGIPSSFSFTVGVGALISKRHVLTAALLTDPESYASIIVSSFIVTLGQATPSEMQQWQEFNVTLPNVIRHHNYVSWNPNKPSFDNFIKNQPAILKLPSDAVLGDTVNTIPVVHNSGFRYIGQGVTILDWNSTEVSSNAVMSVTFVVCDDSYDEVSSPPGFVTDGHAPGEDDPGSEDFSEPSYTNEDGESDPVDDTGSQEIGLDANRRKRDFGSKEKYIFRVLRRRDVANKSAVGYGVNNDDVRRKRQSSYGYQHRPSNTYSTTPYTTTYQTYSTTYPRYSTTTARYLYSTPGYNQQRPSNGYSRVVGPQTQNKAANDVTQNTGVQGDAISSAPLQQQQPRLTSKQAQLKVETQFQAKTALATPKAAKLRPTASGTIRKNVKPDQRVQVNPIPAAPAEDADLVTGINSKQAVIPLSEDPAPLNTGRNPGVEGSWMNAGWPVGLSILPSSDGNYGQGYSNQDYNNSLNPQYWLVPELPWNDLMAVGFHRPDGTPHPLAYVLPPYWIMKALSDDRPMVDFPATHFQNGAWPYFAPPGDYVDEMAQVPYQYEQPISRQQPYVPPVGSAGYSLGNYGNPNPLPNYAYN
ncbi:unnamed protein product [Notodromas monacha]|uniref:Peptidase S1 domain-containing protein n=1 Tax=Notodromas monacha TaxID=399045 RepID=A0A7R9BL31_9CRUS|nr:unnamed protein product [Notodromas monacha]CAG0916151.1 unnamed protein product [Notodromas monacha]